MKTKRILTMQDLSCVGQCSLTVALPTLSALGVEASVLPTAILSNHTMFKEWSYLDLTPEIENIYANWKNNGFKFDGFLLGYLGKASLMELAIKAFKEFSNPNAPKIIDPCFGDNGKLYGGFDGEYVNQMKKLIAHADIILPNVTEACYLTGEQYKEAYDEQYIRNLIAKLKHITGATAIITGVELEGKIGEAIANGNNFKLVLAQKLPVSYHGTGDLFSAAFTAKYLNGSSLEDACDYAGQLVADSISKTPEEHFYGVCFERALNER